jgi:glyoxylase-like metal-dependent hydrolase (beta-lactamase superfamily II)
MRTGRLGVPSAVRSLQLDDVAATYAVDGTLAMRPAEFFPDIPSDYWDSRPHLLTAAGHLTVSAGGLLVERDGATLLIDTGVGRTAADFAFGTTDCGSMLDVLAMLGRDPADIDVVAFTHLHFDHVGWAFDMGRKTFPNARYVMAAKEWAPHERGTHHDDTVTPSQVIPQLAADALILVEDDAEVMPGVRAIVTPGHSPGHTSYVVTSRSGHRLIVFGDIFHIPAQLARPDWMSAADPNPTAVLSARRRLLAELSEPDTVGFGFHFGDQAFGRVNRDCSGAPTWEPVPTSIVGPSAPGDRPRGG